MKPLMVDLYCGLGGWAEGFLANGYRCVGYDIEAHDYGTGGYPGELILRDVRSLHGSQFADAACIVASPPCQAYSYRAMPWKRAKALPPPDNTLFNECFRIQREACEAAGHHIPIVVENVRGAEKWVGPARWHFGSFYLWGDVPVLMPPTLKAHKVSGFRFDGNSHGSFQSASVEKLRNIRDGEAHSRHFTNPREHLKMGWDNSVPGKCRRDDGRKVPGIKFSEVGFNVAAAQRFGSQQEGPKQHGSGRDWFAGEGAMGRTSSRSDSRKAASAHIAKIPFTLADWIAKTYLPKKVEAIA